MKLFLYALTIMLHFGIYAQNPCEYSINVTDSIGTYKETKNYLVYEQNFAGKSTYAYFSLALMDQMPVLKLQLISRSKDFISGNCFDKNSRLYLQLDNGKIITLLHVDQLTCGSSVRTEQGFNNIVLTGTFMFVEGSVDELLKSPTTFMRIKFTTATTDYIFPSELKSELDGLAYDPQHYLMKTLDCLVTQ